MHRINCASCGWLAVAAALLLTIEPAASVAAPATATPASAPHAASAPAKPAPTMAEILAAAPASAWRRIPDEHTLYMELPAGRVVIELEPALAPHTVANIEAFARLHYFDGLAIVRLQDNYVAQWGDADGTRPIPRQLQTLAPEFAVPQGNIAFTPLADRDGYAPQVGFVDGFPAARDPPAGLAWLTHCYGAVGVGRGTDPASGNGSELYAVIGHAPRHLDRNVTVVGRVRQGIELLASLPRGTAELGFYATAAERTPIKSVRLASELPPAERTPLEVLRTDTPTFAALVAARRNRHDGWFVRPAGYIDLCNAPIPVRPAPKN
ncbi:MAG: peptidylprolyl isomerase [Gammaproteobacteria bacterium]|nr:peptidylprolyl isomerase [Gammaproteobacteria bacterium]